MKAYSMLLAMITAGAFPACAAEKASALSAAPNLSDDLEQVVLGELWEHTGLNQRDRCFSH